MRRSHYVPAVLMMVSILHGLSGGRTARRFRETLTPSMAAPVVLPLNADGTVDVSVEVESVTETIGDKAVTSGVYDLRLFRDGQLVGSSIPQPAIEEYIAKAPAAVAADIKSGKVIDTAEDALWRSANELFKVTSPNLKMISPTKAVYTFRNIQLPRDGRKEVEFSAYAFNSDRVKSDTARAKFTVPSLPASNIRKAYIISVGVNASDLPAWSLRYAAKDANVTQRTLTQVLRGRYDVVPVELTSDSDGPKNAIKANIRTVLQMLSGVTSNEADLKQLASAIGSATLQRITRSTPQDMVIVTFSSHGAADAAGNFYLLPSDIRMTTSVQKMPDLDSMISSDELSLWMRDLDASDTVMIIDACYAAASVNAPGFKPAPMGSRGLGQLAYDKQMRILTATREKDAAVELSGDVREGLLTYALIKEGLEENKADFKPKPDGRIFLSEWLEFARGEVPVIFQKLEKGELKGNKGIPFGTSAGDKNYLQQPVLFDFRRTHNSDVELKKITQDIK